jgi:hypothetical protein
LELPVPARDADGETPALEQEAPAGTAVVWPGAAQPSGDAAVDAALGLLAGMADHPVSDHAELYTRVHDALLAELTADG